MRSNGASSSTASPTCARPLSSAAPPYSLIIVRSDLPKFASNTRIGGTAQENEAVVRGSVAHFGSYSVGAGGKVLVLQSEYSSFPNWKGARLTRPFAIAGDQLKYRVNSASGGGVADITWKKIK